MITFRSLLLASTMTAHPRQAATAAAVIRSMPASGVLYVPPDKVGKAPAVVERRAEAVEAANRVRAAALRDA